MILDFKSLYCNNYNDGQQLYVNLRDLGKSNEINTLVLHQKIQKFPPEFTESLNIGNLVLVDGQHPDSIKFNRGSLKVLTFIDVDLRLIDWNKLSNQESKKSQVKSIHIDGGTLNTIQKTFGEVFTHLEFASFTGCQLKTIQDCPIKGGVNAFEMIRNLKFLILSHNNIENIRWLIESKEPAKDGKPVSVGSYNSLSKIDLSYNQINSIHQETFTHNRFPQLKYLNLKGNQFKSVDYIQNQMFSQLNELWVDDDQNLRQQIEDAKSQEIEIKVKVFFV